MERVRERVWGTLASFLEDVRVGNTPLALDEARAISRADPKKEKARLKREADREALVNFREEQARSRLTAYQYVMRCSYAAARVAKRLVNENKLKVAAVNAAMVVHHLMCNHPEGWSLMVGMPSCNVTQAINDSILNDLSMRGYVAAELRRLQRAIGMSTWDIMTCHNRQVSGLKDNLPPDQFVQEDAEMEAQLFFEGGTNSRAKWASGRRPLKGHKLRQASIASWALPPDDAVLLLDLLEYELDTAVLSDLDACDAKVFGDGKIIDHGTTQDRTLAGANVMVPVAKSTLPMVIPLKPVVLPPALPAGGVVYVPTVPTDRERRLVTLHAKRKGEFIFKAVRDKGKNAISPFTTGDQGLPKLPGLSEVVCYSPILNSGYGRTDLYFIV